MGFVLAHRIWLALVLLATTLSSAPFGSMEQGGSGAAPRSESISSVPVVHVKVPSVKKRIALVPDAVTSSIPQGPSPLAPPALILELRASQILPGGSSCTSTVPPPRICERLPYHSNAPPSAA